MKKKIPHLIFTILLIFCVGIFSACSKANGIVSIVKTSTNGLVDTYTITYTNGSTTTFEITNGANGIDGKNGESLDIDKAYAKYLESNPNATFEDFLKDLLTVNTNGNSSKINQTLLSSAKVYCEFTEQYRVNPMFVTVDTAVYLGSAVIYKIESDYTYFITNYHVVYNSSALETSKIAKKITCYLYGSEGEPYATKEYDKNGYSIYDYGDYAIDCEYVGGSITADLAIIKAKTGDVSLINNSVKEITFADNFYVGETAIAIGNPEGEGISVTQGIISVDNEFITLSIDNTSRNYRSVRIDTAIYNGSSGGGLFNSDGKLIGITNAGDGDDQNVNYAIPVDIVKPAVENIMYYAKFGETNAKKITLGITVYSENSKYVYDNQIGYGTIYEDVIIDEVTNSSIADTIGVKAKDKISAIIINEKEYKINRYFNISDILFTVREGDIISLKLVRDNQQITSSNYTVKNSDLSIIA